VRAAHRPIAFDGDRRSDFRPPPVLGEHTREVLQEAGLSDGEVDRLKSEGLVA
jgi:crotonobetainyl-CoA:carnitine CoA-transferase CaiB-like acyl-CoA transferase